MTSVKYKDVNKNSTPYTQIKYCVIYYERIQNKQCRKIVTSPSTDEFVVYDEKYLANEFAHFYNIITNSKNKYFTGVAFLDEENACVSHFIKNNSLSPWKYNKEFGIIEWIY